MIALFSDFGLNGPYIGQVKAVLLRNAPHIPIIDLFPDTPPYRVKEASFLLATYAQAVPVGSVLLCVVDPGVGGERAAIAAAIDGRWFVGPDNGLLEIAARRAASVETYRITGQGPTSATFHGRDIFAPAAARLAQGTTEGLESAGLTRRNDWPDDLDSVVYVDRFGNLFTGRRANTLNASADLIIKGRKVRPARTYSDVLPGELLWYENSNGLAEIAMNQGNAALQLAVGVGEGISVETDIETKQR